MRGVKVLALRDDVGKGLLRQSFLPQRRSLYSGVGTIVPVATALRLDPDLAAVVERARWRAVELGELPRGSLPPYESKIATEVADVILRMLRDGTYAEAVARIAAEDPELADQ